MNIENSTGYHVQNHTEALADFVQLLNFELQSHEQTEDQFDCTTIEPRMKS